VIRIEGCVGLLPQTEVRIAGAPWNGYNKINTHAAIAQWGMGRRTGRKEEGKRELREVAAKNNFGVGFGTRTITLDSDMAAAPISRGANAVLTGYCDKLIL